MARQSFLRFLLQLNGGKNYKIFITVQPLDSPNLHLASWTDFNARRLRTWMGDGQGKKSESSSPNLRRKRECERLRCACFDVEGRGAWGSGRCEVLKSPRDCRECKCNGSQRRPLGSFASTWHIQALPNGNSMSARK